MPPRAVLVLPADLPAATAAKIRGLLPSRPRRRAGPGPNAARASPPLECQRRSATFVEGALRVGDAPCGNHRCQCGGGENSSRASKEDTGAKRGSRRVRCALPPCRRACGSCSASMPVDSRQRRQRRLPELTTSRPGRGEALPSRLPSDRAFVNAAATISTFFVGSRATTSRDGHSPCRCRPPLRGGPSTPWRLLFTDASSSAADLLLLSCSSAAFLSSRAPRRPSARRRGGKATSPGTREASAHDPLPTDLPFALPVIIAEDGAKVGAGNSAGAASSNSGCSVPHQRPR